MQMQKFSNDSSKERIDPRVTEAEEEGQGHNEIGQDQAEYLLELRSQNWKPKEQLKETSKIKKQQKNLEISE